MKHSKTSQETEQYYCDCEFCRANYYSVALYQNALHRFEKSQDENQLVHEAFLPIVRIVIPKSKWASQKYAFDDAQATALSNMFVYYRKKGILAGNELEIRTLIRCAKAGCSYVIRQLNKHERAYTQDSQPNQQTQAKKSIIGRRVYPNDFNDFDVDSFTLLVDGLSVMNQYLEDSLVEQIDAKRFIERALSASNSKVVKQMVANLALKFNLIDSVNENPPTSLFVDALRAELIPFAEASGLDKALIIDFCARAESILGPESVDMKRLRQKAYNREKTGVLTSLL